MRKNILKHNMPPKENIKYIVSSFDVYKRLSPEAYYLYVSLINSKPSFSPNISWAKSVLSSERKGERAIKELQDKDVLEIRQIAHNQYVWLINYTFNDIQKMQEIKSEFMERQEVKKEKNELLNEQIKAWEEMLEKATGDTYEMIQNEIRKLREQL